MVGFIFGGGKDTPWSYEELQRKRAIAESLAAGNMRTPQNVGEGLSAIGRALMYRKLDKKASAEEGRMREEFDRKWGSVFSGGPAGMGATPSGGFTPSGPALPPPDPNSPHALGDDAMAALGKAPVKTAADPASIKAGLVARGLPEHIADGFVMNFDDESNFDPGVNEIAPLVPGSRGGFGLYQLTGPRRRAYEAFAAERGVPVDDVDAQLDFLMMELQGPEAAAWSKISGAQNAGEAGAAIVNHFLRPAEEHRASRASKYLGGAVPSYESAPQGMDIGSLVGLASDPMASPAQKAIVETLIQQQLQAADPLRALEMQKAQLELAQMQNPEAKQPEALVERQALLAAAGIDPASPEGQNYLLTGELPEAPKEATPTDDMREYEFAKSQGYPGTFQDWQIENRKAGASSTTVNTGDSEKEFDKTIGKADATAYDEIVKGGVSAASGMSTLDAMESAMADPNFYSGAGAGMVESLRRGAVALGIADPEAITSMESFNALAKNAALTAMGGSLGAGFSNADRDFVEKQVPTLGNTPEGNREIIRIQKSLLRRKQEMAELARTYAEQRAAEGKRFDQAGFEKLAREYAEANPLFGPPSTTPGAAKASDATDDGWVTLPSGIRIREVK